MYNMSFSVVTKYFTIYDGKIPLPLSLIGQIMKTIKKFKKIFGSTFDMF